MLMDEKSVPLPTADHSAASSNPPPPAYPIPSVSKDTPPQGPYAVAPQQQQGSPYPPNTMQYTTQPQMMMVGGGMPQPQIGGIPQQQQLNNDVTVGTQFQNQLYAQCAQGNHDTVRKYGQCGIITAVCCFPCGLLAMLFDYEERCARCGVRVGGSTIRGHSIQLDEITSIKARGSTFSLSKVKPIPFPFTLNFAFVRLFGGRIVQQDFIIMSDNKSPSIPSPQRQYTAPPPAYNDTPRGQGSPSQAPPHSSQLGAEQPLHPPTSTSSPPTGNNITGSSGTIPTISTQPMNPTAQQQPQPPLPQPPLQPQPQPQYTMQPQISTTGLSNQVDMQSLPQSGPWTPSGTMPQANGGAPQQQQSIAAQYQDELYARCARGDHDVVKKYGLFGIIIAIVCCPCGLLALLFDNEERCARCGIRISGSTI
ncbi:hypothetical protein ABKN59_007504 [Abortiporus biennis]